MKSILSNFFLVQQRLQMFPIHGQSNISDISQNRKSMKTTRKPTNEELIGRTKKELVQFQTTNFKRCVVG